MKKKNLILSLVCSIVLAIGLITFTVVSLVPTNQNTEGEDKKPVNVITPTDQNNEKNDGSEEKPYIIDNAEMFDEYFLGKYINEEGEYIDYNKVKNGNLLYPELNEGLNYKLSNNIDFAGKDFVTIFNKGIAFNGTIDGNGFAFENITINVTKENLVNFMYNDEVNDLGYRAHIAIFGKLDGAKIKNLKLSNIAIKVDETVLEYLTADDTTFVADNKDVMYEITVGTIAGIAFDSEIDVEVVGAIETNLFVPSSDKDVGTNAVGGLVGATVNSDISNSTTKVDITLSGDGSRYFVGGLVGKAYETVANDVKVESTILVDCDNKVYIGGAFGLVQGLESDAAAVIVDINELNERKSEETVADMGSEKADMKVNIAGFVATIDARDENRLAIIKNAKIDVDAKIDAVFATTFIDVVSTSNSSVKLVFIENIEVSADVDVLKAFGFARTVKNTELKTKLSLNKVGYDFALTGNVRLSGDDYDCLELIYLSIDNIKSTFGANRQYALTIALSQDLRDKLDVGDSMLAVSLEKEARLVIVEEKVEIAFENEGEAA